MVTAGVKDVNTSSLLCLESPTLFVLFFKTQMPLQEVLLEALPTHAPTSKRLIHSILVLSPNCTHHPSDVPDTRSGQICQFSLL